MWVVTVSPLMSTVALTITPSKSASTRPLSSPVPSNVRR